jgi:hypothetical protein
MVRDGRGRKAIRLATGSSLFCRNDGVSFPQGCGANLSRLARTRLAISSGGLMNNRHPWPEQRRGNGSTIIGILLVALAFSFAASMLIGKFDPRPEPADQAFFVQSR